MMKNLWVILVMIRTMAWAQPSDSYLKSYIDSMVAAEMKKSQAVGVAIGIVRNGKIWYTKGYGSKKLGEYGPVDSLTNFHLASVSKVFVATALMQLAEGGKISLDGKLLDYLPAGKVRDERMRSITIRQLLTHTSGFPDEWNYHWNHPKNDSLALERYSKRAIRRSKLKFDPGERMRYSNPAFEVLGHVIEAVTGNNFDDYQFRNVLKKAGLTLSSFDYYKIEPSRRSTPHIKLFGKVAVSKVYPYNREHGPSSTLNSCTYDMCVWIMEMLRIYADKEEQYSGVIRRNSLADMWTPHQKSPEPGGTIGWSWFLEQGPLGLAAMHDGQDRGYLSFLNIYPEQAMGVIILVNGSYPLGMIRLSHHLGLLLGNKIINVSVEKLKILEGEYRSPKQKWKIGFKEVDGFLEAKDGSYRFRLLPVADNKFINPEDLALFEFKPDSKTVIAFGTYELQKRK